VTEFLLLDRLFPRSVYSALRAAEGLITELAGGEARSGLDDPVRRAIGRARTDLELRRVENLADGLPDLLDQLRRTCSAISDEIGDRYFPASTSLSWTVATNP